MNKNFEIYETAKHGVFLKIRDRELWDKFDDYISTDTYVLSTVSFHDEYVEFSFGRAATTSKVQEIFDEFCKTQCIA